MKLYFVYLIYTLLQTAYSSTVRFDAQCSVNLLVVPCLVAQFSSSANFSVLSSVQLFHADEFCDKDNVITPSIPNSIAIVNRGHCAFDVKAVVAMKRNHAALVIVNTDSTLFPVGSQDGSFFSTIPVVLVPNSLWEQLDNGTFSKTKPVEINDTCSTPEFTFSIGKKKRFQLYQFCVVIFFYSFFILSFC